VIQSLRRQARQAVTLAQRDVRDLARIASLDALPRLLALAAGQTARLLNVSELAAPFQLSRPTIKDYVTLLERVFLLEQLAPWHSNRLSRLIKTPKPHLGDTGAACALLGLDAELLWQDRGTLGQLLETFVFQELRRQASWRDDDIRFHHFRDKDGAEVDLVLERGGRELAGVEVKAAATVTASDFRGLRKLRDAAGKRFTAGVVLYDGEASVGFGEGKRRTKIIPRFTSESSGLTLLFAVLVDASEGWRGVRMPAYIQARLEQLAEHPESEWEDPDLMKLAA
jgi:uncharacterized protein